MKETKKPSRAGQVVEWAIPVAAVALVFVMLVATGQGNVYLIRERGHFWQSRPGTWLIVSSIADLTVVALMATIGVLMTPVSPLLIAGLLGAVALYLLILDRFKVLIFRRFTIR